MSRWTIYDKDGNVLHESIVEYDGKGKVVYQDTFEYVGKWMGECYLTISIKSPYPIDFQIGDYIEYREEKFTINYDPTVIKKARRGTYGEGFVYDSIKFNSYSNELTMMLFHDWVLDDNKVHYTSLPAFSFYAKDVDDLVDRLQACADRWCKDNGRDKSEYWMFYTLANNTQGTKDTGQYQTTYERTVQRAKDISTDSAFLSAVQSEWIKTYGNPSDYKDSRDDERYDRNISISNNTVWDGLQKVKTEFGLNFIIRGRNVYIGTVGVPTSHLFEYGKGKGLYEVDKTADTDQKVVTRLHAYGSDQNMPTRYYAEVTSEAFSTIKEIKENPTDYSFARFILDLPYSSRYFTNAMTKYGSNIYAVGIKVGDILVNARVEGTDNNGNVEIYSECLQNSTDDDDNTDFANFRQFKSAIAVGARIFFTKGVDRSAFPISNIGFEDGVKALPDNMAVNSLMLPGFPLYSLADICKSVYDSASNSTNYYIKKKPSGTDDEYVLFHTESGKHVVSFSDDRHDPYIVSQNAASLGYRDGDISCTESNDDNGLEAVYPSIEKVTVSDAGIGSGDARVDVVDSADTIDDNGVYDKEGVSVPSFHVTLPKLGFDLRQAAKDANNSGEFKLSMKDGFCGGREFTAKVESVDASTGKITLRVQRSYDDSLFLWFPYSYAKSVQTVGPGMTNAYQILSGDHFVLTGINVGDVNYVWTASVRLLRKAIHWLCKNDYTRYVYTPKIDEIFMARQDMEAKSDTGGKTASIHDTLKEGDVLLFDDDDLLINGSVYIDQLTIKENGNNGIPTYDVTLRNEVNVGTLQRIQNKVDSVANDIRTGNIGGNVGMTPTQVDPLVKAYGAKYFLSKTQDDTAQGLITFAKGLISDMLAQLKGGATFGKSGYKFDKDGNVVVDALSSLTFDEALEHGFGITKNSHGKYTLSVTDLMVWGKAVFNSLEIRKLYAVGGNVYLSGASSKIVRAVPVKKATAAASSTGGDASETWVACAEGDADCEGWKCYTLNDDGTTATQNGWRKYDQAKCQTFDIEAGAHEGVSNTFYWRLVADVSSNNETITETRTETYVDDDGVTKTREVTVDLYDGKKFGWVVLSKTDCESATNDAPKAGDTIVLDGHRMFASGDAEGRDQYNDESRTNVMMLETTGTEDGTLPRIVALTGIVDYKHWDGVNQYSNTVFILSPKEVVFVSSSFKFMSASGDPITLVNFRGNWAEGTKYGYYDQVSHGNAIWTCIVEKGKTTTEEPSDTSKVWRKEISGGKGEKGDKGEDAVTYGVQLSSTYEVFSDAKKHAGIKVAYTKTTGMTVSSYGTVQVLGTAKVYADGTEIKSASDHLKNGYNTIIFDYYTFDGTNNTASIGTASVITVELLVGDTVVATANYSNGKQGDGVVMAYKHADTQPDAPTGTDPEYPGDGWSLSPDAATAGEKVTDVRYGGYESGTYDGNNKGTDATAKEWAEAEDDGRTWMKSPSGLSYDYGYAMMKVSFITQYDNTTVDVEIKAYSEQNYDLVEVWALDTAPSTGTSFRGQGLAHASGNGVEQAYSFTVAKAGRHFICVTYAKDISGDDNGDYGLFRLDLSDNEVAVSDTVWMSQAKVSGGKCVLPWSTPVKINGADGKGALEISVDPDTIVFDTDDDGIVPSETSKTATIACYRDGKKVTNVEYDLMEGGHPDCDASISTSNSTATVTISNIAKDEIYGVSKTSGTVEVQVWDKDNGRYYFPTVKFSVNVAKFNGGLKADNKKFESAYNYLTNDGKSTDFKQFESKIRQTAKEISLKVSEKSVGRRNMLVGSACRKYGDGFMYMSSSETQYYDGYPLQQIEINSGIDGVNCIHCRTKRTGTDSYHLSGFSWNGFSPQGNIKLEKGKNYVLSFYAKTPTPNDIYFIAEVLYQGSKIDTSRPAGYKGPTGYSSTCIVSEANKWELFTVKLSVPSDAKYEYVEINIFARSKVDYFVDGYICKPMLEEGEEYNGWTLSEQDYDYVGGNLLDGTGTLTKTGNVEVLDETTVKQGGYNNESASVKAILLPTMKIGDFLQYSTKDMGLKVGEDCMLSFYARAASDYAPGGLQCYLYSPSTGIVMTESSHEKLDSLRNPGDGDLHTHITPTTAWKRYWVHWRPMGNVPQYILFRLVRPGTNKESYDSSTSYNVGDVVLYGGTYYVCQKAGIGYAPGASSHWEATEFAIEIARPKLEVGATMTEWTEKRADMVDKQALYATGIDIDSKKITLTADHTYVRTNDGTPMVLIDADGNLTNVKVNADMVNVSATHKLSISGNGSMVVAMDNFKLDERGNASFKGSIESTSGRISFLTFTDSGMYSATSSSDWGLGLMSTNISVRGTPGGRHSLVCLGNGKVDATGGDANTYPTSLVNGQNVNYCNLIQVKDGGTGNGRDAAALGIETDGDFCLSAMGGLSHLQGLALDASTASGSANRTLFLCSGGSFTMPSNPKAGQLVIVIQTTRSGITFYGGSKSFMKGASTSNTATSGSAGQWNFFVYDDSVSSWRCVYANGGLF